MSETTHLYQLPLAALREDNLRDFLAALGLLRLFGQRWPETNSNLSWSQSTGIPSLHCSAVIPHNWGQLLWDMLLEWRGAECNPFGHGKIEACESAKFRGLLMSESNRSSLHARFYPALASQISYEKHGRRSEFIIESANRSVLKGIDDLLTDNRKSLNVAADFAGTSVLREVSNTSRWHPAEFQSAAYTATDPKENKHRDRLSLNVFALFGLTFYPVVDTHGGRKTPGFRLASRGPEFSWPAWNMPLAVDELASLLHHPAIYQDGTMPEEMKAIGVHQIWRSRKFCPDGKNDYFSRARPVF